MPSAYRGHFRVTFWKFAETVRAGWREDASPASIASNTAYSNASWLLQFRSSRRVVKPRVDRALGHSGDLAA
jgi:hypothetical protein